MTRSIFRFVAAVSLLLFLAAAVLGVRGRWRTDEFWLVHGDGGSELLRSSGGRISFRHTRPNGRGRLTFPRRFSHWSFPVTSQLPPTTSVRHWEWRFVGYEGTPPATEAEINRARAELRNAATLRAELGVTDEEWERAGTLQGPRERAIAVWRAKRLEQQARELLNGTSYWEWTVPAWAVAAATGILPVLWLSAWDRRRRLAREGRCPQCGYDLRAGHDRCPECGHAVAGTRAAAPGPVSRPGTA